MIFALYIYSRRHRKKVSTIFASIYDFYGFDPKRLVLWLFVCMFFFGFGTFDKCIRLLNLNQMNVKKVCSISFQEKKMHVNNMFLSYLKNFFMNIFPVGIRETKKRPNREKGCRNFSIWMHAIVSVAAINQLNLQILCIFVCKRRIIQMENITHFLCQIMAFFSHIIVNESENEYAPPMEFIEMQ